MNNAYYLKKKKRKTKSNCWKSGTQYSCGKEYWLYLCLAAKLYCFSVPFFIVFL